MKIFSSIAAAAVIGTSFIAASPVKAGGCYPPTAAKIIDQVIKGGGSPKEAMDAAVSDGNINNQVCVIRVKGYMRNHPLSLGSTSRAMGW